MTELLIIVAQCPDCGVCYSSWSKEEATRIYYERHTHCLATRADKQIHELLDKLLEVAK